MAIHKLKISNFKSIKSLDLDCKKINVFIGEPNTGKSNILEAIGLLSHICYGNLFRFVRLESNIDLFYDQNLSEPIRIRVDDYEFRVDFQNGRFNWGFTCPPDPNSQNITRTTTLFSYDYHEGGQDRKRLTFKGELKILDAFKFYRFSKLATFHQKESDFLSPPDGENLLNILLTNKDLKGIISTLFKKFGYRLVFKPSEGKIEVQKNLEDIIISIPYSLCSETLQRITFCLAAIYSNKDSIISFEEPEAHAFPYYTKYLAERIAMDSANNQYFIATHNPYFLTSIMEKTPKNEIATFVTYFEDYQTKVKALSGKEIERALAMGSDVFFNIDQFLEKDSGKGN